MSNVTASRIKIQLIEVKSPPTGIPTQAQFQLGEVTLSANVESELLVQNELDVGRSFHAWANEQLCQLAAFIGLFNGDNLGKSLVRIR